MLNMLWSRIFDVTFPSTILTISSRLQTQFNQNEKNRDWKVNWILLKEPTRIICVEITKVGGVEKCCRKSERAKSSSVSPIASPSVHVWEPTCGSGFKHCQKFRFWEESKFFSTKVEWLYNAINYQVLHHSALRPLLHCCCQCPVSNANYFTSSNICIEFFLAVCDPGIAQKSAICHLLDYVRSYVI